MARVIVRYHGNLKNALSGFVDTSLVELFHQYGIVTMPEQYLTALAALPEVEYIEPPETLFFDLQTGRNASCITGVQGNPTSFGSGTGLTGKGVFVAILDSGECVIILSSHCNTAFPDGCCFLFSPLAFSGEVKKL